MLREFMDFFRFKLRIPIIQQKGQYHLPTYWEAEIHNKTFVQEVTSSSPGTAYKLDGSFSTVVCCKILLLFEKNKVEQKEAGNGPFFKKTGNFNLFVNKIFQQKYYQRKSLRQDSILTTFLNNF